MTDTETPVVLEDKSVPPKKRRSWLRIFLWVVLYLSAAGMVLLIAAGAFAYLLYEHITAPGTHTGERRVTIPDGATGRDAARILSEQSLVEHEYLALAALKLDKTPAAIKAGDYDLPIGASASELVDLLQEGPNVAFDPSSIPPDRKVTVPEGLTIVQMAELFEDPEAFVDAASNAGLIQGLGIEAESLEGFLMPNTYYFDEKPTAQQVVERMVSAFQREYAALVERLPEAAAMGPVELVTIASLIEEEARDPAERPVISAVIHNRLEKGMPLQMDSTLQYALNKYGERLLDEDKAVDSPYNTYLNAGLPPGPISSPGVASLEAAAAPADVDYLYFVSNADGRTHTFSKTLNEHTQARSRYQREIRKQREELRRQQASE